MVYPILNFFNICMTRFLFFIFPIIAAVILLFSFISGIYLGNYSEVVEYCRIESDVYDGKDKLISFEINSKLNEILNNNKAIEIDNLIKKIESEHVHKNYLLIELKYPDNHELAKMIQVIKRKDEELQRIQKMIQKIKNIEHFSYSVIQNISNEIDSILNIKSYNRDHDDNFCNEMILGCNIIIMGTFFLCIGLILMSVSVCMRRPTLDEHIPVSNVNHGSGHIQKDDKIYVEEIEERCYFYVIYLKEPEYAKEEDILPLIDGDFGYGYYLNTDNVDAIKQFVKNQYYSYMQWNKIMIVDCRAYLGNTMIMNSFNSFDFQVFGKPKMKELDCVSCFYDGYQRSTYFTLDKSRIKVQKCETVDIQKLVFFLRSEKKI